MMSDDRSISVEQFGVLFKAFLEQMTTQTPVDEPLFLSRIRGHFDADPAHCPILSEEFEISEQANLQIAIEECLARPGRSAELLGVIGDPSYSYAGMSLTQLLVPARSDRPIAIPGPVQYVNIDLEGDSVIACVQCGLYLIGEDGGRLALLVRGPNEIGYYRKIHIEVMARDRSLAERFLAELRASMRKRNIYRGRVVSLDVDRYDGLVVQFHKLPNIEREQIILPAGLLDRIERQTVRFAQHSDMLLAAGRHLKRGILLHGSPGTGKTLTAMYLASRMSDRTVLLLTGRGLGLIEQSCAMARALQPSMVVLEDVDLVAEERTRPGATCTALLFELLNQMDGLADDADVIFLLTTNRPDILEPALASRPGRVDQAIEVPLPDSECRRRLFDLYSQGMLSQLGGLDEFIKRTEGASAAFIRELMRKAALFAADETGEILVKDRHIDEALHELVIDGGELTRVLLGVRKDYCE
jgi:hypothetical protein